MSTQPDQPLAAASIAQLVAVTMRLAMEVTVLRDRLQAHEALLARHGLLDSVAVDAYAPDAAATATRDAATRALIMALAVDLGAAPPSG